MPVIPAPAGHGHSSARAPVRPAQRRRYLRHAMPDCASPATCHLPPAARHPSTNIPTWLLVLCCTSTAPPRQCSLDCNLAALRAIAPLHSAGPWPGSPLQLVDCYWYLADRDGPNCSCAADERHGLLDATAQCSHRDDTGHGRPCSLDAGNFCPFVRQNPCSCVRRSLLFSTMRLQ
jgi:hypothetical protein